MKKDHISKINSIWLSAIYPSELLVHVYLNPVKKWTWNNVFTVKIHRYNPWRRHLRALSPGIWHLHSPGADPMLWSVNRSAGHHYANSTKTIDIERRKVRRRRQLAWLTVSKTILGLVQDFQQ